jgi:riboflavin kinase / FMN adenylyltransferase
VKIYHSIEEFKKTENSVVTTGTFDGVHLGHKVIIDRLKKAAKDIGGETVLLTFFPHPRMVLYPDDNELRLLNTIDERKEMLKNAGIDHLIIHPFSLQFSRISSIDFVRDILVNQIGTSKLVIGYDHHFGRNREGSFEHLKEFSSLYGFDVEEIPAQEIQEINISSTKVRHSLIAGEINAATQFLGYNYSLSGTVVEGNKVGREIGFPTANIKIDQWYKLIPASGVYAVKIFSNSEEYKGMLNIGNRPTLNGKTQTIEVNIFNFSENIYNNTIRIEFYDRIRNEQNFSDISLLKKQLEIDKEKVIQLFNQY